jgi:sucrose-6-phosphate hydrolase SacC (GH32 family)
MMRERGWILREGDKWHLWYTGYNNDRGDGRFLGYATSDDGLHWRRWPGNPLTTTGWVEDVCVVRHDGAYHLFAEGRGDIAHRLSSTDGVHWEERGDLDIRQVDGRPISAGPRGTPTVWVENGRWYLYYERRDAAVWLATSSDLNVWTNVSDDPVIVPGPDAYDRNAVAVDQIVRHNGRYYAYYHGSAEPEWNSWNTNLAVSDDLVHWRKYAGNPVLPADADHPKRSSAMVVREGSAYRLYTTHPDVRAFRPIESREP